jgi:hypothetical protein
VFKWAFDPDLGKDERKWEYAKRGNIIRAYAKKYLRSTMLIVGMGKLWS